MFSDHLAKSNNHQSLALQQTHEGNVCTTVSFRDFVPFYAKSNDKLVTKNWTGTLSRRFSYFVFLKWNWKSWDPLKSGWNKGYFSKPTFLVNISNSAFRWSHRQKRFMFRRNHWKRLNTLQYLKVPWVTFVVETFSHKIFLEPPRAKRKWASEPPEDGGFVNIGERWPRTR